MKIISSLLKLSVCCLSLLLIQCGETEPPSRPVIVTKDTLPKDEVKAPTKEKEVEEVAASIETIPASNSEYFPLRMKDSGRVRLKRFTAGERSIIYSLNRIDASNVRRADTLVIPQKFAADLMSYSPFPEELPALREVHKIVFFSYPIQAFAAYENGRLVKWGPSSMGKKSTPTPTGLFFTNWKAKEAISTVNDEWKLKWNFNVSNKGGVGWHEYAMPGYPASHSCMRLLSSDAQWLYDWADQWKLVDDNTIKAYGTPTVIYGSYAFGQRKPWLALLNDPQANQISVEELEELVNPSLAEIMEKQRTRDALITTDTTASSHNSPM